MGILRLCVALSLFGLAARTHYKAMLYHRQTVRLWKSNGEKQISDGMTWGLERTDEDE
jgi:hypothetical protein